MNYLKLIPKEVSHADKCFEGVESNIQLFFDVDNTHLFVKGTSYHDAVESEVKVQVHYGMFEDTYLLYEKDSIQWNRKYLCRYFITNDGIEFYDTLYVQQDYLVPLYIHNVGKASFKVSFQWDEKEWTIMPGERTVFVIEFQEMLGTENGGIL